MALRTSGPRSAAAAARCLMVSAICGARAAHMRGLAAVPDSTRARALACASGQALHTASSKEMHKMERVEMPGEAAPAASRPRADPSLFASSHLSVENLNDDDIRTLERQLGYRPYPLAVGARCKHGFPQAFVWDPLSRQAAGRSKRVPVDSGLFRLTCPLLVKAIDEWEAEGAVAEMNRHVGEARKMGDTEMYDALVEANHKHAEARRALVGDRVYELLENENELPPLPPPKSKRSGPPAASVPPTRAELVELVLNSGVAGMSPEKAEVKCLHAQVADHLCRSHSNLVAARILEGVAARGFEVEGDDVCRQQCDVACAREKANFWYVPVKNKQKLRTRLTKRKARKSAMKAAGPDTESSATTEV
mmetsp:Transcript_10832/g.33362  ORF Transcript_10832/g.33362 Transcript_10832/m.33362 type:complete len:365 (+) Transcript_10832:171-1265(+)|eukprot:scaffold118892_cov32-Tisochrysis_lutea.AAC.6